MENSLELFRAPRLSPGWLLASGVAAAAVAVLFFHSLLYGSWLITIVAFFGMIAAFAVSGRLLADRGRGAAALSEKGVRWASVLPDVQRESLSIEVQELAKILDVSSEQINDLQSTYIVAEDLALREIQNQENVPIMRNLTIGGIPFDAVLFRKNLVSCIDVSFILVPDIRQEKIDAMLRKVAVVKRGFQKQGINAKLGLMLVLITQLSHEDEELLRKRLNKQKFEDTPVDVDIRLLDFESLQKIYVTE